MVDSMLIPIESFALSKNISIITSSYAEQVSDASRLLSKVGYLDFRDTESSFPSVVLLGGLQGTIRELIIYG